MASKNHPAYTDLLPRLNRAEGQLAGIKRMIEDERYCVDILIQFQAVASALKGVEAAILERHLKSCVHEALTSKNKAQAERKAEELTNLFLKRMV